MTPETAFEPGVWIADTARSHVGLCVRRTSSSTYRARFERFEATLRVDARGTPSLAGRGRIGLGAREHDVTFESRGVRRIRDHVELDGVLTVGGHPLVIAACGPFAGPVDDAGGRRLGIHVRTRVDHRQFGLDLAGAAPFDDEVLLEADLQLVRAA